MQFLSISDVIFLQKELIAKFGGLHGIRDQRLLESALEYPRMLYAIALERDPFCIAAAYACHIIGNHPFLDGNKRIGTLAMLIFLRMNGAEVHIPKSSLYKLAMAIAQSKIDEEAVAEILRQHGK